MEHTAFFICSHVRAGEREGEEVNHPIVALAFLTEANLRAIGKNLEHVYPIDASLCFEDLLRALDDAEQGRKSSPRGKTAP